MSQSAGMYLRAVKEILEDRKLTCDAAKYGEIDSARFPASAEASFADCGQPSEYTAAMQ